MVILGFKYASDNALFWSAFLDARQELRVFNKKSALSEVENALYVSALMRGSYIL